MALNTTVVQIVPTYITDWDKSILFRKLDKFVRNMNWDLKNGEDKVWIILVEAVSDYKEVQLVIS